MITRVPTTSNLGDFDVVEEVDGRNGQPATSERHKVSRYPVKVQHHLANPEYKAIQLGKSPLLPGRMPNTNDIESRMCLLAAELSESSLHILHASSDAARLTACIAQQLRQTLGDEVTNFDTSNVDLFIRLASCVVSTGTAIVNASPALLPFLPDWETNQRPPATSVINI